MARRAQQRQRGRRPRTSRGRSIARVVFSENRPPEQRQLGAFVVRNEHDCPIGSRRGAECDSSTGLGVEESGRGNDKRTDRRNEQFLVTHQSRTVGLTAVDRQCNTAQTTLGLRFLDDTVQDGPWVDRPFRRADLPSQNPECVQQMERAGRFSPDQVDGHRLGTGNRVAALAGDTLTLG